MTARAIQRIGKTLKKIFWRNWWELLTYRLPVLLLGGVASTIIVFAFRDIHRDTTPLTNIGFAILGGIATLSFNWGRSLNAEKDKVLIANIHHKGEMAFFAALLFLLASGLKYAVLYIADPTSELTLDIYRSLWVKIPLQFGYYSAFLTADYFAYHAIEGLVKLLRKRVKNGAIY